MNGAVLITLLLAATPATPTPSAASSPNRAEQARAARRTAAELRLATAQLLRAEATAGETERPQAIRSLVGHFHKLAADETLTNVERQRLMSQIKTRLRAVADRLPATERNDAVSAKLIPGNPILAQQAGRQFAGQVGIQQGGGFGPARQGGAFGAPGEDDGEALAELIQTVIAPDSWDVNGGNGTIVYWRNMRALVVRQTDEVHDNLGGALEQLRRAGN